MNKNTDILLKKIVLSVSAIIFVTLIVQIIFSEKLIVIAKKNIHQSLDNIETKNAQLEKEGNDFQNRVDQGMADGIKDMQAGMSSLSKGMDDFADQWKKDMKMLKERHEAFLRQMADDQVFIKKLEDESENRSQAALEKIRKGWDEAEKRQEDKRLKNHLAKIKPYIECEKLMFGKTRFNLKRPFDYQPSSYWPKVCEHIKRGS